MGGDPRYPFNRQFSLFQIVDNKGFSFIELMLTVVVFSLGFVSMIRIYSVSLDRLTHLTYRIYADQLAENAIAEIEYSLRTNSSLPFDIEKINSVDVGSRRIDFEQSLHIQTVDDLLNVFQVDFQLSWKEGQNIKNLKRSAYVSNLRLNK